MRTHLREGLRVWYVEAPHPVLMPELLEVPLVRAPAPVRVVTANLARKLQVQAVQFVQPIRDGFPVPAHWQLERVVNLLVLVVVLLFHPIVILLSLLLVSTCASSNFRSPILLNAEPIAAQPKKVLVLKESI